MSRLPESQKHLAIDLDDVVLDFTGGLRESVLKEYDVMLPPEAFDKWEIGEILNPIIGINWWKWLREREWLWAQFPAVNGAVGGLNALRRAGFYLECVTSKPEWAEHNTWKWLGKWRPPFNRVTIVGPMDRKVEFTDAYLLVDDKVENIEQFLHDGRKGILFDRHYNRESSLERALHWREVVERILSA